MARVPGLLLVCVLFLSISSFLAADSAADFITVNGVTVSQDTYLGKLEQVEVQATKGGKKVSIPAGEYVIEQFITELLLVQLAEKEGVAPTAEQIDGKISFAKRTNSNVTAQLAMQGISEEDWRKQLRLQQAVANLLTKGVTVTDAEVKKSYDTQLDSAGSPFKTPEACHVSVISCENKARIDDAHKRLSSGKDFAEVAKDMSEDKSTAPYGGSVGWISSGMASVPEIIRITTFATPVGTYSKPVFLQNKDDKAWVIIKVDEKRPERLQSFDEVKELIREQLAVKKADRKAFDKRVADFVKESKIGVGADRFKDIPEMIKKNASIDVSVAQPAVSPGLAK